VPFLVDEQEIVDRPVILPLLVHAIISPQHRRLFLGDS
jgi:hypothetical protein